MKLSVIANPVSGKQRSNQFNKINETLNSLKLDYDLYLTEKDKNATKIIEEFTREPEILVVSGGDGTISETIQGLHNKEYKSPILMIPSGTTNEIASNYKIKNHLVDRFTCIKEKRVLKIDYGLLNDKDTFVYSLTFGTFTRLTYETPQWLKNIVGYFAYLIYGFFTFRKIDSYDLTINLGEKVIVDNFTFAGITNSKTIGSIINLKDENPDLSDGLFEVFLIRTPKTWKQYKQTIKGLINKDYRNDQFVLLKSSELVIESDEDIALNIDGENAGKLKRISVKNKHKGLKILLDSK